MALPLLRLHTTSSSIFRLPTSSSSSSSSSRVSTVPNSSSSCKLSSLVSTFTSKSLNFVLSGALALGLSLSGVGVPYAEAKVGVNKPELLPKEYTPVIDVAGILSDGQAGDNSEQVP